MISSSIGLAKVIFNARSSRLLFLAGILSVGFSFAVILCTQGIMNGYVESLMEASHRGSGDIQLIPRTGLSQFKGSLEKKIKSIELEDFVLIRQMESFLIHQGVSKGVVIRGVDIDRFKDVTEINLDLNNSIAIGEALAKEKSIQIGDMINLAFARGNQALSSLPIVRSFKVSQIITHGIYEKDSRFIYMDRTYFNKILKSGNVFNLIEANLSGVNFFDRSGFEKEVKSLRVKLTDTFKIDTFINQHEIILKAVEVEKMSISIILYLIVFIAIFNIAALIYYIREKRLKEFFLFWAMGLSIEHLKKFWLYLVCVIWLLGGIISLGFCYLINNILKNFLVIPGEIYVLNELKLLFRFDEVVIVLFLGLFWMILVAWWCLRSLYSSELAQGLKREF